MSQAVTEGQPVRNRSPLLPAVVFLFLSVTYSILNPFLQAPDEGAHVDLVRALEQREGWPAVRGRVISPEVTEARAHLGWSRELYPREAEAAPPRSSRPTFEDLEGAGREGNVNHITQHPPLYYGVISTTAALTGIPLFMFIDGTADRIVNWYRVLNSVLGAAAIMAVVIAIRVAGGGRRAQLTGGVLLLAVPQLTYLSGAVNNDNGLFLTFAILTLPVLRILQGKTTAWWAFSAGIAAGAAMIIKVFGGAAVLWLAVVYGFVWLRSVERAAIALYAVISGLTAGLVGGVWWIKNYVVYGQLQPPGMSRDVQSLQETGRDFFDWIGMYFPRIVHSFFGKFGIPDVVLPTWLVVVATVAFALVLLVAGVTAVRDNDPEKLLLLVPLLALVAVSALHNYLVVFDNLGGRVAAAQGRYWFAAAGPTVVFVAMTLGDRRLGPTLSAVAAIAMQAAGLSLLLYAAYAGPSLAGRLVSLVAWSPWPPWVTGSVLLVTMFSAVGLAIQCVGSCVLAEEPDAPVGTG